MPKSKIVALLQSFGMAIIVTFVLLVAGAVGTAYENYGHILDAKRILNDLATAEHAHRQTYGHYGQLSLYEYLPHTLSAIDNKRHIMTFNIETTDSSFLITATLPVSDTTLTITQDDPTNTK